ncbi:protein kinase [Bacillus suaedaesalsae]|uniref:Protein kinase n=1 Tax=Bacillus suaedaesalsae TaxID=2810349 RepID=A0ABS2DE73_9BACI|nr:protein kinase [Bacillus suaedaesalsae]MBM6616335.1 protein kinase [Bacillus suaedaesalsae]
MEHLKSLTGIYYLGLGCGLWNKEEVIDWSDKVIVTIDNPPLELLEVSMMSKSKIDDIENKLFELSKIDDEEHSVQIVLSIIAEMLELKHITIERAIRSTSRLLVHTGLSWESRYYNLYSFDDSYDLACNGVHFEINEVEKEFINELEPFKKVISEFKELYFSVTRQEWAK